MAPSTLSGRIIKTRKGKKTGTTHQRNHRFESFTVKISKLDSLDPIRKPRQYGIDTEDLASTTSYFKAGLAKWEELARHQDFVHFYHEVLPLSDSLPQILHHEDKIMGLFVTYLEKKEREIMQPLLDLLTDFAHDLGTRFFENHYSKALEMITIIARTPQDVDVVDWSNSCLTFMFKWLSKLLVTDLRPTFDIMAPLMGKDRVPPHTARFSAEALSFLVKKAAAPAHRGTALPLIIFHAKHDLQSIAGTRQSGLYYHGLMTLFAHAMKGIGQSIHTSGTAILRSLFMCLEPEDFENDSQWMDVICGVITSMVHHTTAETFRAIQDEILNLTSIVVESFEKQQSIFEVRRVILSARMIGIMAGVRKSSRISDWPALLQTLSTVLKSTSKIPQLLRSNGEVSHVWEHLVLTVAITIQYAPMDAMIPFISTFMDSLTKEPLAYHFLAFCTYLSEAEEGPERFRSVALHHFKR